MAIPVNLDRIVRLPKQVLIQTHRTVKMSNHFNAVWKQLHLHIIFQDFFIKFVCWFPLYVLLLVTTAMSVGRQAH